jgi:peptidoglycan biosynthesis protein MviN/MurJ (putative lipid II flippase)
MWAVIGVAVNVPLMLFLAAPMGVEGLALALSIATLLEVAGLLLWLRRRIDSVEEGEVLRSAGRSALAAVVAALLMLGGVTVAREWAPALLENAFSRLVVVAGLTAAGGAIYLLVAAALRAPEIAQMRSVLARRRSRGTP